MITNVGADARALEEVFAKKSTDADIDFVDGEDLVGKIFIRTSGGTRSAVVRLYKANGTYTDTVIATITL